MVQGNAEKTPLFKRLNWVNTVFLIISPILAMVFLPIHLILEGFDWRLLSLFVFFALATGLSITAGYHRLFAHRSYEVSLPVKLFYLIFGAAALQGSAIKWSSDHRRHHKHVDEDEDPYSVRKGFFFAHMGWFFFKDDPKYMNQRAPDLVRDRWVFMQDQYYMAIAIIVGFLVPTLIGLSFGAPWGGLLFGSIARVVVTHHSTFFINSLCHMWGAQPYTDKNTAKDSFLLALFTHGEGYHNFHHRFEADYRNGIKWYHWDPTKWLIKTLSFVGLAKNLRKIPDFEIFKAQLYQQERILIVTGRYNEKVKEMRVRVEEAKRRIIQLKNRYKELKRDITAQRDQRMEQIKIDLEAAKQEFRLLWEQWCAVSQLQLA